MISVKLWWNVVKRTIAMLLCCGDQLTLATLCWCDGAKSVCDANSLVIINGTAQCNNVLVCCCQQSFHCESNRTATATIETQRLHRHTTNSNWKLPWHCWTVLVSTSQLPLLSRLPVVTFLRISRSRWDDICRSLDGAAHLDANFPLCRVFSRGVRAAVLASFLLSCCWTVCQLAATKLVCHFLIIAQMRHYIKTKLTNCSATLWNQPRYIVLLDV